MKDFDLKHLLLQSDDIQLLCSSLVNTRIDDQHMINNMTSQDAEEHIKVTKDLYEQEDKLYLHLRPYCPYSSKLPKCLTTIKNTYFL